MLLRILVFSAALAAVSVTGCGSSGPQRQAVSGAVTFKGEPLADGSVTFEPVDSKLGSMSGAVVKGGKYAVPAESGLFPGRYTVRLSSPIAGTKAGDTPGAVRLAKERLPERYNTKTTLSIDVTADGPNTHDFKLD